MCVDQAADGRRENKMFMTSHQLAQRAQARNKISEEIEASIQNAIAKTKELKAALGDAIDMTSNISEVSWNEITSNINEVEESLSNMLIDFETGSINIPV